MRDRDIIIEAVAKSLFIQAYANFVEDRDNGEDKSDLPRPGCGQDWYDFAPETSPEALKVARKAIADLERLNGCRVTTLYKRATAACLDTAKGRCVTHDHTLKDFGADLGMMLTGSGVSWFDDHARFEITVPRAEFYILAHADIAN